MLPTPLTIADLKQQYLAHSPVKMLTAESTLCARPLQSLTALQGGYRGGKGARAGPVVHARQAHARLRLKALWRSAGKHIAHVRS